MSHLMYDSEVINIYVSKLRIFLDFFGRKSPLFSLKIQILKIQMHGHVAEVVCFHEKSSYGSSNIRLLSSEPKCVEIADFLDFFGRIFVKNRDIENLKTTAHS